MKVKNFIRAVSITLAVLPPLIQLLNKLKIRKYKTTGITDPAEECAYFREEFVEMSKLKISDGIKGKLGFTEDMVVGITTTLPNDVKYEYANAELFACVYPGICWFIGDRSEAVIHINYETTRSMSDLEFGKIVIHELTHVKQYNNIRRRDELSPTFMSFAKLHFDLQQAFSYENRPDEIEARKMEKLFAIRYREDTVALSKQVREMLRQ